MGIRVKLLKSLSGPAGDFVPGDEFEIHDDKGIDPRGDSKKIVVVKTAAEQARRLVALGVAKEMEGHPIPKAKGEERHPVRVEVVGPLIHDQEGVEYGTRVRPARRPKRGDRFTVPAVEVVPREYAAVEYADQLGYDD